MPTETIATANGLELFRALPLHFLCIEDMLFYRLPKTLVAWARNPTYNVCFDHDTTRNPRPILCLQGSCLLVGK